MNYIGRFAPSPSGLLHFGSLTAAIASYLDAKHHQGKWLIRIEDIDPPREMPGASEAILKQLENFALLPDEAPVYQSHRLQVYQQQIDNWLKSGNAYPCNCTRKRLKTLKHIYNGACKNAQLPTEGNAIRFCNTTSKVDFNDRIIGHVSLKRDHAEQDFIIKRKDGLIAYQLAVVLDDIAQNITHIVRGADLLDTTIWQQALYKALNAKYSPQYAHLPLAYAADGRKLSKQNGAKAISAEQNKQLTFHALQHLQQSPPDKLANWDVKAQLQWAIEHWDLTKIAR
ncbi:tRNA glutamyl-Q(34) synthetase GluQRS [Catenovulum sediminis]|uniref:Glutamyl-Q tRNA(Asp) synthetase n=2 Tax=Catenovulum sediminis TaxID=1740262 RepID=A0ABV1RKA4_9ALTE|nr:tRNA glutamyl-Q(34) synthetase GluQRS [Catenovulum sediminis]